MQLSGLLAKLLRAKVVAGSRHAWWLIVAGLTGGNEQYWACRGELVRFRMPQGWMVTRIPALIFDEIVEIGCLYFLYFNVVQEVIAVIDLCHAQERT